MRWTKENSLTKEMSSAKQIRRLKRSYLDKLLEINFAITIIIKYIYHSSVKKTGLRNNIKTKSLL